MKWTIDPSHTTVQISARHMMVTTVRGRFSGTTGEIEYDAADPLRSRVRVTVPAASVDTGDEKRDAHLRSPDFLDAERYPTITFESRDIRRDGDRFKVTGDLTIRGTTKPVTVDVAVSDVVADPWGGKRVAFEVTGKFDRRDWGLVWNMPIANGGLLVSNELGVEIDIQAVAAEDAPRAEVDEAVEHAEEAAAA